MAHNQPQQTTEWENQLVANPKDNFITTIWDAWWAINSSGNPTWRWREVVCLVLWILYSKIPIRQQIRDQNHGGSLRLYFPQRNKGNYLWKTELPWWLWWLRICLQCRKPGFDLWVGKIPWRRKLQPTPVFLPGEFHGQRNQAGYSPWGHKELDTTERLKLSLFTAFPLVNCWFVFLFALKLNSTVNFPWNSVLFLLFCQSCGW